MATLELLTKRETEILKQLAKIGHVKGVAQAVKILPGTVEKHLAEILRKLEVDTTIQAVVMLARSSRGPNLTPIEDKQLSEKEELVLILMSRSGSPKGVAKSMRISPRTVESILAGVRKKLDLETTIQAVAMYARQDMWNRISSDREQTPDHFEDAATEYADPARKTGGSTDPTVRLSTSQKVEQSDEPPGNEASGQTVDADIADKSSSQIDSEKAPDTNVESITGHVESDHATSVDTLGFKPYVHAVAMFLRHEKTEAPFTMSIDGQWGCGKSSFMLQLQDELRGPDEEKNIDDWKRDRLNVPEDWTPPLTVWFNPWRHDKDESLWAAFALTCLKSIDAQQSPMDRRASHRRLRRIRLSKPGAKKAVWQSVGRYLIAALAVTALFLFGDDVAKAVAGGDYESFLTAAFGTAGLGSMALVGWRAWKLVEPLVKEPVAKDLLQHLKAPDYASKVSYLSKFHDEFKEIVETISNGKRVYVFIDDLDRCEVPRAAELMQAINLLTAGGAPLHFIIGMDREKVAAGVAAKHKDVLEHLEGHKGLDFGYSFIQKFIQLPFRVPTPGVGQLEGMLTNVVGVEIEQPSALTFDPREYRLRPADFDPAKKMAAAPSYAVARAQGLVNEPTVTPEILARRESQIQSFDEDSDKIREVIRVVAPFLDYNPRRVKQFAGLLRLQFYLAVETGICDPVQNDLFEAGLTIGQIGKFIALTYLWPQAAPMLKNNPRLMGAWTEQASQSADSTFGGFHKVFPNTPPWLPSFILAGIDRPGDATSRSVSRFSLDSVDPIKLMGIARLSEQTGDAAKISTPLFSDPPPEES